MSEPAREHNDSPEVAALRKMIRGGALSDDERALLARVSRRPTSSGDPLTEEQIEALLSARADG